MVISELHENFAGYWCGERRMHIAASSSHHTLDANKETASSGGLAGNRRDKKGFWPVYYSLELFIIFTAFPRWFGGRGKAVYPKARRWMMDAELWIADFKPGVCSSTLCRPAGCLNHTWRQQRRRRGGRGETNTRDIKSVIHGNSQTSRSQPAALRLALSA